MFKNVVVRYAVCGIKRIFDEEGALRNLLTTLKQTNIMKFRQILILLLCLSCSRSEIADIPAATSPVISEDISNNKINAIAEDSDGHIWIGTFRGLNKYTGREYHQYYRDDTDSTSISDNQVLDLLCSRSGEIWVSTITGLNVYTDQDNFRKIRCESKVYANELKEDSQGRIFAYAYPSVLMYDPDASELRVVIPDVDKFKTYNSKLFIDEHDNLWAVDYRQIKCYNTDNFNLEVVEEQSGMPMVYAYDSGKIWCTSSVALKIYDTETHSESPVPDALTKDDRFHIGEITNIFPYPGGLVFSTLESGLFYYNYASGKLYHQSQPEFPFESPDFRVSKLFVDSNKNVWLGSSDQGIFVSSHYKDRFNDDKLLYKALEGKSVSAVAVDKQDNLWVSTFQDGTYRYSPEDGTVLNIPWRKINQTMWNSLMSVGGILASRDGSIWQIAYDSSVRKVHIEHGREVLDKSWFVFLPMSIYECEDGTIVVTSALPYLYCLRPGQTEFEPLKLFDGYGFVPCATTFDKDNLLVCAFGRKPMLVNLSTSEVMDLPISEEDWQEATRHSGLIPVSVCNDNKGNFWIGTVANGLLCYNVGSERLRQIPGISCTDVSSVIADKSGNLWIGTQYGLSKYNTADSTVINYFASDGIGGNQFYDRAACMMADGRIVLGGTHGVTVFSPEDVGYRNNLRIVFETLKVHNQVVKPSEKGCIKKRMSLGPDINLKYYQNGFSISYSALDYGKFSRVKFRYKLDGFDHYWIDAGSNREAYYANLPAGKYKFRVRLGSNDSNINETESSVNVTVNPAPWASWWAWLSYVLILSGAAGYVLLLVMRIRKERQIAQKAEMEKAQEHHINQMNMNFFANVSHEFRTPLTLIAGPISQIASDKRLDEGTRKLVGTVQHSVDRMLKLVNQMLDFNKLEEDALHLQVHTVDAVETLRSLLESFSASIAGKNISLQTVGLEDTCLTLLDDDKVDKIFGNLLSNALKYTQEGGKISVCFDVLPASELGGKFAGCKMEWSRYIKVSVANSGKEIPESEREKIFERYYQIRGDAERVSNMGTGIGLYYARKLAMLHHGYLFCENPVQWTGAMFTFVIPVDEGAYASDERSISQKQQKEVFPLPVAVSGNVEEKGEKRTVIVVDDDTEIVAYLKSLLSPYYNVICRFDADNALTAIKDNSPDCILCDIVMPDKDGFELCAEVRGDMQICHIPLILVTANTAMRNQVKGLNTGANAYVTKPFDPEYLLALINSLIQTQDNVKKLLSSATQTDALDENVLSPQDGKFMSELYSLMEKELSNPELNVVAIAERMCMSRTKFYYKVKGLTGENPAEFFKMYKLNRAAQLLKEGQYTISEIADLTGFSTLSVFSKVFKAKFGVSPSNYR